MTQEELLLLHQLLEKAKTAMPKAWTFNTLKTAGEVELVGYNDEIQNGTLYRYTIDASGAIKEDSCFVY